ncbi:hypothetical protein Gpo141_00012071 [Globisporangium polare]
MSGRAYARNAQGFLGGGADLESIVPHTFRIAAPKRVSNARELAIRRVIRRRCMEKNWKKLISRRRVRLESVVKDSQTEPSQAGAGAQSDATTTTPATTGVTDEANAVANGTTKPPEKKEGGEKSTSAPAATAATGDVKATENGARKPKQEKKPDSETMDLAKRQLLELEAKLKSLVEQKHAKFLQLKNILVEEARSKSSSSTSTPPAAAPGSAAANGPAPAKKRRIDLKDGNGMSPQADQGAAPSLLSSPLSAAAVASASVMLLTTASDGTTAAAAGSSSE